MIRRNLFNRFVRGAFAAVLGLAVLSTPSIRAEEEKPAEEVKGAKSLEAIALADQLIRYGRSNSNPEALILAARLLHQNPTGESKATIEGGEKIPEATLDLKGLITEARAAKAMNKLKPEDEKLLDELIDRVADEIKEEARGAVGGPKAIGNITIPPSTSTKPITIADFEVGKTAVVQLCITMTALQAAAHKLCGEWHVVHAAYIKARNEANAAIAKASQMFAAALRVTNADAKVKAVSAAEAQGDIAKKLTIAADAKADAQSAIYGKMKAAVIAARDEALKADPGYYKAIKDLDEAIEKARASQLKADKAKAAIWAEIQRLMASFKATGKDPEVKLDAAEKAYEAAFQLAAADHKAVLILYAKLHEVLSQHKLHVQLMEGTKVLMTREGYSVEVSGVPTAVKKGDKAATLTIVVTNKSPAKTLVIHGRTN